MTAGEQLCATCGHWHDKSGRPLLGWRSNDGNDRRWPLPRGHRPPDHAVDGATGWEPIHGTCVAERVRTPGETT